MLLRLLDRLEEIIIAGLIGIATVLIFAAVLHRFASGTALLYPIAHRIDLSWAQELCVYMFVWMAKFGAAYGVRTGIHVGVDVLVNRLSPRLRTACVLFAAGAGALFTGVIGTLGALFVQRMMLTQQVSPDLELPKWIVYLAIPLGSYLMCFRFLQVGWSVACGGPVLHRGHAPAPGLEAAR